MAWWKVRQRKASARGWAIAASVAIGLQSIPFGIPIYLMLKYSTTGWHVEMALFAPICLLLGIAGLVVFVPRESVSDFSQRHEKLPREAGDGTSGLLDALSWTFAIVGYLYGQHLWWQWAANHSLQRADSLVYWPFLLLAILIETFVHECGHTLVGLALGMNLRAFVVGPFQWRLEGNRWRFKFLPAKILSGGGLAAMAPTDPKWSKCNEVLMVAGGPLASLCTGFLGLGAVLAIAGSPYHPSWELFSMLSTFGFVAFGINLIPQRPKANYSDGACIYQLLANGPMADFRRVVAQVSSSQVSPTRPRDYDIALIQKAAKAFPGGHKGVGLRLFAFDHYLDCGQEGEAYESLREAAEMSGEVNQKMHSSWFLSFVFGHAYLGGDAVQARKWWDLLRAEKGVELDSFYWMSKSALHLADNDRDEAEKAWSTGYLLAGREPSGSAEYGLDCYGRLRKALDESSHWPEIASEQDVLPEA